MTIEREGEGEREFGQKKRRKMYPLNIHMFECMRVKVIKGIHTCLNVINMKICQYSR